MKRSHSSSIFRRSARLCPYAKRSWADALDKARDGIDHGVRLILVRRVTAIGERDELDIGDLRADAPHLLHRTVLVPLALDRKHRTRDARQILLDVPRPEFGVEPDPVPAPED